MFYEVHGIDIGLCLPAVGAVIRLAFAGVAEEFHLTPRNCRYHPAFLSDSDLAVSLQRPDVICFGALADDLLVGFAAVLPKGPDAFAPEPDKQAPQGQGTYELTRLCVLPAHRHAGLGARLMQAALQATKEHGARRLEIGVIDANERLKAWYESHGFRATAVREYAHLPFRVCGMEREI